MWPSLHRRGTSPRIRGVFQLKTRVSRVSESVKARADIWKEQVSSRSWNHLPGPSFSPAPLPLSPCSPPHPAKLLAVLVGGPRQLLSLWWCRSGKGSELEGLPPYLWKKAGKIQLKAEGIRGGQGLSEVTLPWPDDDQLWGQPRAAWPGSSL